MYFGLELGSFCRGKYIEKAQKIKNLFKCQGHESKIVSIALRSEQKDFV